MALKISPHVHYDIPTCIMISLHSAHDIPHGTEHPPLYSNQSSDFLQHSQNRPTGDRWLKF